MSKGALQRDRLIFISLVDILLQLVFVLLILVFVIYNDNVKTANFGSVLKGAMDDEKTCKKALGECQTVVATYGIDRKPCIEIDGNNGKKTSIVLARFGIHDDGITLLKLLDSRQYPGIAYHQSKVNDIYMKSGISDPLNQKLSYDRFKELFNEISSECRYYASVSDMTAPTNKAGWQRGLGAVLSPNGFSTLRQ